MQFNSKKNAILGIILFCIYIILDLYIDETLLQYTYKLIFSIKNPLFIEFSYLIKTTSLLLCEIIFLYLYLSFNKKLDVLLLILFSCVLTGTHAFLKEIYNQGRPYMFNSDVQTLECIAELGKPSGHAICIVSYMISLYQADRFENEEEMKLPLFKSILYTIIALIVCLSRVILGVHSIGQVIYGIIFTLCMYMIYLNIVHQQIKKFIHRHIKYQSHKLTIFTAILFLVFLTLSLSADFYSRNYFAQQPDLYYKYMDAVQECRVRNGLEKLNDESGFILQRSTSHSYGYYFIIIGALLGLVIFRGVYEEGLYEVQSKFRTRLTLFIRIMIFYLMIFSVQYGMEYFEPKQYESYLIMIVVGHIILGLCVTLIYPILMYFLGLEIYGSMQCVNKSTLFIDYSHIWESDSMIQE
ncbi:unnamed protein product [Paramecium pentaurelia]|uniref:Phosphatidic acid phosphatase type 2/haloperoxidase domain-containing protein n=1 Tax=Paramecium pentaurelia TaxID=43138 RepID=A0A8S1XKG9_9CILI|nr:unnamed protein product [Paramecium pentaurelia]